jgi:hypothetical protein
MPSEVQVIACLLLPSGSISLSGIYERSAAVVCDLRHIFAHLGFGSQCRYDRSARRSMANESGMIAKHNRFTARLKTTPQDLSNLHHYLHNIERLRHDGRYVRIRPVDDR